MRKLKTGDWVEVRDAASILATLDTNGRLDGMPFMPEMLGFCGRRFRVGAIAHKTCDTATKTGGRSLEAVHLAEVRCDGSAHGGCQAECLLFWKPAWLKPADGGAPQALGATALPEAHAQRLAAWTRTAPTDSSEPANGHAVRYACQATLLPSYTKPLSWWHLRQYVSDVVSGNHSVIGAMRVFVLAGTRKLLNLPFGFRVFQRIYDLLHRALTGRASPYIVGLAGKSTPRDSLELRPGEWVRVRDLPAIAQTLNHENKNRGLSFDPEMACFSGGRFRVRRRVTQIINEQTGEMMHFTNPCIMLEGVYCRAHYSESRLLCPRAIPSYWRESWLERIEPQPANDTRS